MRTNSRLIFCCTGLKILKLITDAVLSAFVASAFTSVFVVTTSAADAKDGTERDAASNEASTILVARD